MSRTSCSMLSTPGGPCSPISASADAEVVLETTPEDSRRPLLELMLEPLSILARCRNRRASAGGTRLWIGSGCAGSWPGSSSGISATFGEIPPQPGLSRWLDELAVEIGNHPRRVCHRDYHLNNLLVAGDGGVGVIDIQDILVGPDTYDVVSLVAERAATRLISDRDRGWVLETWAHRTRSRAGLA